MESKTILVFGEALWDCLPAGLFFGGAPVNSGYHLAQLGNRVFPITSVGRDFLGEEAKERLARNGMELDLVHMDEEWPTGAVKVSLNEKGNASYEILSQVAWDRIQVDAATLQQARQADALIFGTLAQRSESNQKALAEIRREASGLFTVYDVNLRPPFDDPGLVAQLAQGVDLLKLNDDEAWTLSRVSPENGTLEEACHDLAQRFKVDSICVTRGEKGAAFYDRPANQWTEEPGKKVTVEDTVGSGDAFLAALTHFLLQGKPPHTSLAAACRLGEFVATQRGATPAYDPSDIPGLT